MKNKIAEYFKSMGIEFEVEGNEDAFYFYFKINNYKIEGIGNAGNDSLYALTLCNKENETNIANNYATTLKYLADFIQDFNEYHKKSYDRIFERMEMDND